MQQAPVAWAPRVFLLSASVWGVLAGALVAVDGAALLVSRWSGNTLALVHMMTLGVLANAMLGSLLQFLPVAAGMPVRGGRVGALALYALLNVGAACLVVALRWPALLPPIWGGGLLLAAFVLLCFLVIPGVRCDSGQWFLRQGLLFAVLASLFTALLGALLTLRLLGVSGGPSLVALTDVHASWGLLGWVLGLLAAVSRVVGPMFQGVAPASQRGQGIWQGLLYGALLSALFLLESHYLNTALRFMVGGIGLYFAVGGLWRQLRAPRLRKAPLTYFWMAGQASLAAACCVLLMEEGTALWVGVLALMIGLPLLITGMQLEIIAFLGWIELQRRCGRGVHLLGVQLLVPQRDKAIALALHLLAALLLLMALGGFVSAHAAGVGLVLAYLVTLAVLCGPSWRARQFVRQRQGA